MNVQTSIFRSTRIRVLVSFCASLLVLVNGSHGSDGVIPITQDDLDSPPYMITNAGSYQVVENLAVGVASDGIRVEVDNVTIDLNGFTLQGFGGVVGSGIYQSSNYHALSVYNGSLRDWGTSYSKAGILALGQDNRVERVRVSHCGNGIELGLGGVVRLCTSISNQNDGIEVEDGVIEYCVAIQNGDGGLGGYAGSVVRDSSSYANGGSGIYASGGQAIGCAARENGYEGIRGTYQASIAHCSAFSNITEGIYVSRGGTIAGCIAVNNLRYGIYGHTDCVVRDSVSRGNGWAGFYSYRGLSLESCSSAGNHESGINLSEDSFARRNLAYNNGLTNGGAGLFLNGSRRTRVEANHLAGQTNGIDSVVSISNVLVKNSSVYNEDNYSVPIDNVVGPVADTAVLWQKPWANFSIEDN